MAVVSSPVIPAEDTIEPEIEKESPAEKIEVERKIPPRTLRRKNLRERPSRMRWIGKKSRRRLRWQTRIKIRVQKTEARNP